MGPKSICVFRHQTMLLRILVWTINPDVRASEQRMTPEPQQSSRTLGMMDTQSVYIINTRALEREHESRRDSRKVAANQDIGTRMVMEAQIETGPFASQKVGGPLNVTKMLAAVVAKKIGSVTTTR